MKLEEVLPAARNGAVIRCTDAEQFTVRGNKLIINDKTGEHEVSQLPISHVMSEEWTVLLPARVGGDTDSREPSTTDRPVPGYGGYVLDIQDHDVFTSEGRSFLDNLGGPEIAQIDGRWLYVDPSLQKVNG